MVAAEWGGAGKAGPRLSAPGREPPSLDSRRVNPSFTALRVWLAGGSLRMFSFLSENNPFQSIPFLEKPQSPQQSPRPSVLKNMHLPCHPLLPWICLEQQLILCK